VTYKGRTVYAPSLQQVLRLTAVYVVRTVTKGKAFYNNSYYVCMKAELAVIHTETNWKHQ